MFTGHKLRGLLIQMQNVSLWSSGRRRQQNFEIFWGGFKSDTAIWTFNFCFLSSPLFSLFLHHFFFLLGIWVGFIMVGNVFTKACRILGLDERWVVEQDFHGNIQVNITWFFAFFSGVFDWIVFTLVWFERSLHSAQVSGQSYPRQSKLMTSQAVERMLICMAGYGQLRGEWVNDSTYINFLCSYEKKA